MARVRLRQFDAWTRHALVGRQVNVQVAQGSALFQVSQNSSANAVACHGQADFGCSDCKQVQIQPHLLGRGYCYQRHHSATPARTARRRCGLRFLARLFAVSRGCCACFREGRATGAQAPNEKCCASMVLWVIGGTSADTGVCFVSELAHR